ncbi:MAG: SDR family NAD(P)-dependent oxidoreductase [Wujia sp.]
MNIAVVTGASSGMGREFVYQIAEKYQTIEEIWVIARRRERLEELADDISGVKIRIIVADVTDRAAVQEYKELLKTHKPFVRVLVNAAGYGIIGHFDELSESENCGMVKTNCVALTAMLDATIPYMKGRNSNIINLASSASFLPQPSFAVYAASKSYVLSLSLALNKELKKSGIRVTAVCPGPVNTEFFDLAETHHEIKLYKQLFKANPKKVVKKALTDAYHGKTKSIYGLSMNMLNILAKLLPHNFMIQFIR